MSHALFMPHSQLASLAQPGAKLPHTLEISGDEAHHALRVKRLVQGDALLLMDGAGTVAHATIASTRKQGKNDWFLHASIDRVVACAPITPRIEIFACAPKGDLLEHMIDQLSQCGVERYVPLLTARTVSDASQHNLARLERITQESLKQCLRPWLMQLGSMQSATLDAALNHDGPVIVADATGTPWHASAQSLLNDAGNKPVRICIGPEGGFTPDELARARAANACMTRFTPHTLRIETAAIVAAGLALAHAQAKHEPL